MAVDAVTATSAASVATAATAASATAAASSTASASATLNYNDFLQLLIAQMKDQDPTSPMDASAQISQLASFSQVEQQIATNSHLETVLSNQMLSQAASYVGKTIVSADATVTGVVNEVSVYSDGIIAITAAGDKVLVQPGISVTDGTVKTPTGTSTTANTNTGDTAD
jgi:flagellar basal-body rod modification protein FlgD